MKTKNLRTMVVTTSTGKDVKDTDQLSGESHTTASQKQTNNTGEQYQTGKTSYGALGGENTNS